MENRLPEKNPRQRRLAARLDRAARDMNAFLLVLAIGLATLDLTCLWAFKLRDALPAASRTAAAAAVPANKPTETKAPPNTQAGASAARW
jgi:hypothetical protein